MFLLFRCFRAVIAVRVAKGYFAFIPFSCPVGGSSRMKRSKITLAAAAAAVMVVALYYFA
jgi:hypothetical protein